MGTVNKRGVWVPAAGDGLLEAWQTMAGSLGTFMPVASTEAASAALTAAEAAGMGATASNPLLFLVGSTVRKVAYVADGSKTSGKWNLSPLNEVEAVEKSNSGWSGTLAAGDRKVTVTSDLPARPYDRVALATVALYGHVTSGSLDVFVKIGAGALPAMSRLPYSNAASATAIDLGIIPANTAPSITAGVSGGAGSGGTIGMSGADSWNRLQVVAFPISMSV